MSNGFKTQCDHAVVTQNMFVPYNEVQSGVYILTYCAAAICGGIVAAAATLLVLNIGVMATGEKLSLLNMATTFHLLLHWSISFGMLSVLWAEFHAVFMYSPHWDGGMPGMACAHLAGLPLVPFASGLVAEHPVSTAASLTFAILMTVNGLLLMGNAIMLGLEPHLHHAKDRCERLPFRIRAQFVDHTHVATTSLFGMFFHCPLGGILRRALAPVPLATILWQTVSHMEGHDCR